MKKEKCNRNLYLEFLTRDLLASQRLINNDADDNETFRIMSAALFLFLCYAAHFFPTL